MSDDVPGFEVHILEGEEIAEFLESLIEGKPKSGLNVGDRVREIDGDRYGHVTDICDCPMASALGYRCIDVQLHENCGGKLTSSKEKRWEHID
jgi:hypothetical protein